MDEKSKIQTLVRIFEARGKKKLVRDLDSYLIQNNYCDDSYVSVKDLKDILNVLTTKGRCNNE